MKLITLNIWGGHVRDPLLQFIKDYRDIDIFCLQEVYHNASNVISTEDRKVSLNIFSELQSLLPEHQAFFRPAVDNVFGLSMFVKKEVEIVGEGEVSIHDNPNYPGRGPTHSRILQWLKCRVDTEEFSVLNVHGLWNGKGKTDTEERLAQSYKIRQFMDGIDGYKIVCGDFNLRPDTESLKIIEKGMNNLIQTYKVQSTRTSFYSKEERFADYIFTSPEIKVNTFDVLKEEVSDHAALLVDFI